MASFAQAQQDHETAPDPPPNKGGNITEEERMLSYLYDGVIHGQIPTEMTDDQAIALDDFLREMDIIGEREEIAITTKLPPR